MKQVLKRIQWLNLNHIFALTLKFPKKPYDWTLYILFEFYANLKFVSAENLAFTGTFSAEKCQKEKFQKFFAEFFSFLKLVLFAHIVLASFFWQSLCWSYHLSIIKNSKLNIWPALVHLSKRAYFKELLNGNFQKIWVKEAITAELNF